MVSRNSRNVACNASKVSMVGVTVCALVGIFVVDFVVVLTGWDLRTLVLSPSSSSSSCSVLRFCLGVRTSVFVVMYGGVVVCFASVVCFSSVVLSGVVAWRRGGIFGVVVAVGAVAFAIPLDWNATNALYGFFVVFLFLGLVL